MASDWYYKQGDQEIGPHTFRDLVDMVREEKLTADVLVRPEYMDEWQRADSVVGLFHMAQRDPATLPPITENSTDHEREFADTEDLATLISPSEELATPDEVEKPGWLKRLLSLRSSKIPAVPIDPQREINVDLSQPIAADSGIESENALGTPEFEDVGTDEEPGSDSVNEVTAGAYSDETWSSAIGAAVDRIDARAPKPEEIPEPKQIVPPVTLSFLHSPVFRNLMKVGAVIGCASFAIYGIVDWLGQGTLYFPFIGVCSPLMFLLYSAVAFLGMVVAASLLVFISSSYLRLGFKLGSVLLTTGLTITYLLNWSEDNFILFPTRNTKPSEAKLIFPYIGECSSFAYWMYFFDVVVLVAVITFFAAWWLEAHADDV